MNRARLFINVLRFLVMGIFMVTAISCSAKPTSPVVPTNAASTTPPKQNTNTPTQLPDQPTLVSVQPTQESNPLPNQPVGAAGDPVLYFSDLTSGPKTGNSDTSGGRSGSDGAIVTVWGVNLGSAQGESKVLANAAEAASVYSWGNAAAPADLSASHRMQMVSFQVSQSAQDGVGEIYVVVNGKQSNSLPFTVRAGNIYFAQTTGNDDSGDGSWGNPWRTLPKTSTSLTPGDIAYIGDGVNQIEQTNYDAAVNLSGDGEVGRPKALIVYPGATSKVGNETISRAFHVWNEDTGNYSLNWVVSRFSITTGDIGLNGQGGFRVIGNHVTSPNGNGADGALGAANGSDIYILGNELENVGSPNCSKLYHSIYVTGVRQDNAPRGPTESNREVAWNYIHDNMSDRGINIYSEQEYSSFITENRIHDNVIMNQRGDGIMLGYYVIGDNWIYNNLIVNAGQGPEWSDDASYHTGIRINTGHESVNKTNVYIYNNTLYGNGWADAVYKEESGSLLSDKGAFERSTTLHFSNNIIFSTGEPYVAVESALPPSADYGNCWFGNGAAPAWDTTAINLDPGFADTKGFNFQLTSGSPCIDVGKDVSSIVIRDLFGFPRPQGLGFDMGVFEYIK